jgi:hypothetical protein
MRFVHVALVLLGLCRPLAANGLDPAKQYRPWTVWWWFGNATPVSDLKWELAQMDEAGIGGVEINPVYAMSEGGVVLYSKEWREKFIAVVEEAERRGMTVVLRAGSGWPFGGPWIEEKDAARGIERSVVEIADAKTVLNEVPRPSAYSNWKAETLLRVVAWNRETGETVVLPVPDADGWKWSLPAGRWQMSAVWQSLTGQKVKRAAPGGEGWVLDHFRAAALDMQLRQMEEFVAEAKKAGPRAFAGIASDSLELDDSNWCDGMFEEFRKRRGYDLTPWLPHLWERIDARSRGVRQDFLRTLSELQLENYFGRMREWAHARGLKTFVQAHGGISDALRAYGATDVPDGETIWPGKEKQEVNVRNRRLAASAGALYGKPVVSAESYTWLRMPRFLVSLDQMKAAGDAIYLDGINQIKNHGYSSSSRTMEAPGQVFYASTLVNHNQTWWPHYPALAKYVTRMNYAMQAGERVADIALYHNLPDAQAEYDDPKSKLLGDDDAWHEPDRNPGIDTSGRIAARLHDVCQRLQRAGYGFDIVNDDAIVSGALKRYRAVWFVNTRSVPVETMRAVEAFAKTGGRAVGVGRLPADGYGLQRAEEQAREVAAIARRAVRLSGDLESAVRAMDVWLTPDYRVSGGDVGFVHRREGNVDTYFVANNERRAVKARVSLRVARKPVQSWDPMTGARKNVHTVAGKRTEVEVELDPWGSALLVLGRTEALPVQPKWECVGCERAWMGAWAVSFGEKQLEWPELRDWLSFSETRSFGGIAVYRNAFEAPSAGRGRACFERVEQSAEVVVNSASAGVTFLPPYCVEFPVRAGKNEVEVRVANTWANYIESLPKAPSRIPGPGYGLTDVLYGPAERPPQSGGLIGRAWVETTSSR